MRREHVCGRVGHSAYILVEDATCVLTSLKTLSSIQAFFLAMANNPECQKAAQNELDQVLGGARLPTFADRDDLPYLAAAIREALRWHVRALISPRVSLHSKSILASQNVIPLGIPHCTTEDDEYEGYFIPKGTTVIPNIWYVLFLLCSM